MKKQYMMTIVLGCALVSSVAFGAQADVDATLYEAIGKIQAAGGEKEVDAVVAEYSNKFSDNAAYADILNQVAAQTKANLAQPMGGERVVEEAAVLPEGMMLGEGRDGRLLRLFSQARGEIKAATTAEAVAAVYDKYLDQFGTAPMLQDALYDAMNARNNELQGGKKGGYKRHMYGRCSDADAKAGRCERRKHGHREQAPECHASGTCQGQKWGHRKDRQRGGQEDRNKKSRGGRRYSTTSEQ